MNNYQSITIGEVAECISGFPFASSGFLSAGKGNFRVVRGDNLKEGFFEWGKKERRWLSISPQIESFLLQAGDILVGMDGSKVGKNWSVIEKKDLPALLGQRVCRIRAKDNFEQGFLAKFIGSKEFYRYVEIVKTGTSIPHISKKQIEQFVIRKPALPEQKKIAEILSGIDHAISAISKKQEKINLILSQLLIDSTTPQASSAWRKTTIGEIVNFQGGSQPPRSTFKFAPEEGYIRMLQIRDYKSDSKATYIPLDLCRRFCDKEDVMIGRYGPPNFQILRGKEGSYNVALIKAIPKNEKELKKEYLFRFLQRKDLFLLMDALSQRTSGQQGLDMDALKEFPISLPDPSMQEHICKSLAAIESISLGLQHREQSLGHLKSGISDQLLSGRKRVNV